MTHPSSVYRLDRPRAVDGDTVAGLLSRDEPLGFGLRVRVYSGYHVGEKPAYVRLIHVDTPERNTDYAGWVTAKQQAADWLAARAGRLEVEVYGSGGLGRLLGDVYATDDRGDTLTQHMLRLGYPLWRA